MVVPFCDLPKADLVIDEQYEGGAQGHAGDDPISKLIGAGNQGGFRLVGARGSRQYAAIVTNSRDPFWPDGLDPETGIFTYFGDNKTPGNELHSRVGNQFLADTFTQAVENRSGRLRIPPIFIFEATGERRNVRFLGLCVPGIVGQTPEEGLEAIWRTRGDQRFQNYRARFTVLDCRTVDRRWIDGLRLNENRTDFAPEVWTRWRERGIVTPLLSPRSVRHRTRNAQLPASSEDSTLLTVIYRYFSSDPFAFEHFAARIVQMSLTAVVDLDVTRRHRDGGRDATAKYRIGRGPSSIFVDFAIEAKCYGVTNGVGVRELARLISRLRHRQFGVLVTTSYVSSQAYQELMEDAHPIVVVSGRDIVHVLRDAGMTNPDHIQEWVTKDFPLAPARVAPTDDQA